MRTGKTKSYGWRSIFLPLCALLLIVLLVADLVRNKYIWMPQPVNTQAAQLSARERLSRQDEMGESSITPLCNYSRNVAFATASSNSTLNTLASRGSCSAHTSSSFPYLGHDVFMDFAHHVFQPGTALSMKGPSIVYLHPKHVPAFAAAVTQLQHNVVLVSNSNFDECLPWSHGNNAESWKPHVEAILNSNMVVSWWGPNVVLAHPKLKHLPLGSKWNWWSTNHHGEDGNKAQILEVFRKWAPDPAANFRLPKPNLMFAKMTEGTSDNAVFPPSRGRRRIALRAAKALLSSQPSVKPLDPSERVCRNMSGFHEHVRRLEQYLFEMRQYKFVLSPVGNGEDTHRTWEALLAGSIPIVESSVRDRLYEGLPVLIVKSWEHLSMQLLQEAYANFTNTGRVYQWEKLFAPYYLGQLTADLTGSYMSAAKSRR